MAKGLYYYEVAIVGHESFMPIILSHPFRFSKKAFTEKVQNALLQAMRDGWEPDDYEVYTKAAEYLVKLYGFEIVSPVASYHHREFSLLHWTGQFHLNLREKGLRGEPVLRPRWVPKEVADLVEQGIRERVEREKREKENKEGENVL